MTDTAHALESSRTLWELIERRAELTPDRPVLLQGDRTLTFGALRERCERVAAGLYGMGVRPGTVVAWQLPTRIETAVLSFALARLGAVQSPGDPLLPGPRGGLRAAGVQGGVLRGARRRGAASTTPRWRGGSARGASSRRTTTCPTATRGCCRRRPATARPCGGSTGPRARPPTPRACCTPTVR